MIPADTNRNTTVVWPLADLLEALRLEGFQLRPDDYLEVVQVLNAFQPQSQADLQALIAPLIVTSEEEQEKFDRIFERVWQQEGLKPHSVEEKPLTLESKKSLPWGWLTAGLLGFLILGYVAFLWPGPAFQPDIHLTSASTGPFEVGDTLVFGIDSSLRRAAGSRARWQWERPDGQTYPRANGPELQIVAQRPGPLVVNLRSQRGRGLLFTTWTDSLRGIEHPICDKLPVLQLDSIRLASPVGSIRYRFTARVVKSSSAIQLTQWRFDGSVVAQNQNEWEQTFRAGTVPAYHDVSFDAFPDTSQRLCSGEAKLVLGILAQTEPSFTLDVRQTGALIVPKTQLDQRYYWALWLVGILLLLLVGYYFWMVIRDALKKDPEITAPTDTENPLARFISDEPPLEIPLENRDAELITRDQPFYQMVRMLRQPTEGEIRRLHIPRTMQATMREGGFPTLIFQPHLSETAYLFLIDRSQVRSQQVALFEYLFRAFMQESVYVERFFFHKTFDTFTNEKQTRGLTLRQLADTYRQHTLIIWSNGYPLLYPPYPVVEPHIREALADWESRAILTPVPFADWGSKERALQADFLLLPADLIGQLRLLQALNEKQTRQDTYLRQQTDELYSIEYVDFREVDELRDYLGEDLFQWLAALALYPRIRWEVVVEMGRALMPPEAVNFTNLLKLARISWMHEGNFPDYTRLELLKALRPDSEAKARQTLLHMLKYAEQYFPGEHFYDGEKYLLQTVNQFTLYAHDADTFADYQPAQEEFKKLYDKGLYPDGAMLRYLENPNGQWSTLLPSATSSVPTKAIKSVASRPKNTILQDYFANLPVPQPEELAEPVEKSTPRNMRRIYAPGAILVLILVFSGVWYFSSRPENQVIDRAQQIPVTLVLEQTTCVNDINTSAAFESITDPVRWTVFLNDSLYSVRNRSGTRSFTPQNLTLDSTNISADSVIMRATLSVNDATAESDRQYKTIQFSRDTLRVRINCPLPVLASILDNITPRLRVSVEYTNPNAPIFGRIQTFMNTLETDSTYQFIRPLKPATFTGRSQVRYFRPADKAAAEAMATRASAALGVSVGTQLTKDKRSPLTHLEVWLNNGTATQQFTCQTVPISWINRFNGWQAIDNGDTYRLAVAEGRINLTGSSNSDNVIRSSDRYIGLIERTCQQNGVYLLQLTNNSNEFLIIRNVTRTSCSLAVVDINTSQLNGLKGQTYFDKLVASARFRRYTPPKPRQPAKADPVQQTAPTSNDNEPNVNQTNQAVQTLVQTSTENLRLQAEKDATVQAGMKAYQRGEYAETVRLHEDYLARNPSNTYVWLLKGYALIQLGKYQEAEMALKNAVRLDPKYALAYFHLARAYCGLNEKTKASDAILQATELQTDMLAIMRDDKAFMSLCGELVNELFKQASPKK